MIFDSDSAVLVGPVRDNRCLWTLDHRFAMNPSGAVNSAELHASDIGVVGEPDFRIAINIRRKLSAAMLRCGGDIFARCTPAGHVKSLSDTQSPEASRRTIERILGFDLFHAEF